MKSSLALQRRGEAQARFLGVWYPFLAAAIGLLAAAQLTLPQQFVRWALPAPAGALALLLTQLGGALALLPCAALHTLADAAKHDRLASATYRQLNLGIIAYFAVLMVSVAAAPLAALDRWFRGLLLALAPFAFSAAGAAWVTTADARQPLPLLREAVAGTLAGAWDLLSTANAVSAAYAMAAAAAAVVGTSFLYVGAGGGATGELGVAGGLFLRRCLGAGVLFQAVVLYTLKDAADRGRLGASTFKALNLALFVASLAQANVLGRAYLAGALELRARASSLLVVAVGQALLAGYQYSTAKKR